MNLLFRAMITNALIISLAATGGYVGGLPGAIACVVASVCGTTVVFKAAVDAHAEGFKDGKEATEENNE